MKRRNFFLVFTMLIAVSLISGCSSDNGVTGNSQYTPDNQNSEEASSEIPGDLEEDPEKVQVYFFWGEGCQYCANQKEFHDELEEMFPGQVQFMEFETYYNPENVDFMRKLGAKYNMNPRSVPLTFIGDQYFEGFARASIGNQMIATIEDCIADGCESPLEK
ncbi:MAG: hypothetical protein ACOCUR_03030 [Nanoarchaeota archaeon]